MPQIVVTILVGIASLVAFIGLVRGVRAAKGSGEWNPSSTYFLLVPAIYFAPMAVGQLTGAVTLQFDVFYNHVTVMAPWLLNLQRVTVAMLTVLGGITFVRCGVLQRNPINPVAFLSDSPVRRPVKVKSKPYPSYPINRLRELRR